MKSRDIYDYGKLPGGGCYLEVKDGLDTIKTEYHDDLYHVRHRIRKLKAKKYIDRRIARIRSLL